MESTNFINHKGKLSDLLNVCRVPSTVLRFYKYVILDFSPQPYKVGTIVMPIYQIKKLRLREGNRLVREQTVRSRLRDWIHSAALQGLAARRRKNRLGLITSAHRRGACVSGQIQSRKVPEPALELLLLR